MTVVEQDIRKETEFTVFRNAVNMIRFSVKRLSGGFVYFFIELAFDMQVN